MNAQAVLYYVGLALIALGFISIIVGLIVLLRKSHEKQINEVLNQTSKMVNKSLLDDVGDSIKHVNLLLEELNNMIQTERGTGIFLVIFGSVAVGAGIALYLRLFG